MKYQIADLNNGPFGDIYDTLEEAEKALTHEIEEDQEKWYGEDEESYLNFDDEDFYFIVEVEEN